jgi:hypothetical protein
MVEGALIFVVHTERCDRVRGAGRGRARPGCRAYLTVIVRIPKAVAGALTP